MNKHLKRFVENRKALAYIWGVAACTIIFIPVVFWVLSVLLDGISTSVLAMYTFTGATASAWLLVKTLISVLLGIVLFVVLLWATVNAKAQSYES